MTATRRPVLARSPIMKNWYWWCLFVRIINNNKKVSFCVDWHLTDFKYVINILHFIYVQLVVLRTCVLNIFSQDEKPLLKGGVKVWHSSEHVRLSSMFNFFSIQFNNEILFKPWTRYALTGRGPCLAHRHGAAARRGGLLVIRIFSWRNSGELRSILVGWIWFDTIWKAENEIYLLTMSALGLTILKCNFG